MSRTTLRPALRTAGALAATAALSLSGLTGAAHAAPMPQDVPPVFPLNETATRAGADWLLGELEGGLLHNSAYGFDDYGLTIDAAYALGHGDLSRKQVRKVGRIAPAIADSIDAYLGTPDIYAGSAAKALVLAEAFDQDPRAFGGVDLVTTLEGRVSTTAPVVGRLTDKSTYGDFANTVGQSYAVRGLAAADSARTADATEFLLAQQCREGYFRLYFNADPTAAGQGCVSGAAGSEPDTDATAIAALSLALSGQDTKPVTRAVRKARAWLLDQQRGNGSFGGGTSTSAPNANSTGLAGTALGMLGKRKEAAKSAVWVRKLQPADLGACRSPLTKDAGAIAYDRKALAAGRADGLAGDAEDQWRRSTAQALPVLGWAPEAGERLRVVVPKQASASARTRITVEGLAKGENACLSFGDAHVNVTGKSKPVRVSLSAGKVTGPTVVKVRTLTDTARARTTLRR